MNASPKPGRRGPRIVLALILGAVAATTTRARVLVAKATLPAQSALTTDNVEVKDVSTDAVQPNAAASLADVQGKALTIPVAAGQQILTPFLANADQPDIKKFADLVPAGKRA